MWKVLGCSWGLCVRSGAALDAYVGGPGAVLGPMLAIVGRSWAALGALMAVLAAFWLHLGPMLAILGRSWGLCGRSRATLRAPVRDAAALGACGWSWAAHGAHVGGLGPLLGLLRAVWGRWSRKWHRPELEGDLASLQGPVGISSRTRESD